MNRVAELASGSMLSQLTRSPLLRVPLVVAVVLAVQTSIASELRPFGVAADLMLLLSVAGGLVSSPERGAIAGFFIGLSFDLVLQTPFGLSALVYSLTAFALGYLRLGIERSGWWMRVLAVALASAVAVVAFALLGSLFGMTRIVNVHLLHIAVVVAAVNAVLAAPALGVMRWALTAEGT